MSHSLGPWRWEFNLTSKSIDLVGGRPLFDKTVMDFERWGMGRACPRFNEAVAGGEFNIMTRVSDRPDWREPFPGREHHANWLQNVIHPDARLIAAAPLLLESLKGWLPIVERQLEQFIASAPDVRSTAAYQTALKRVEDTRAAIAAATGEQE